MDRYLGPAQAFDGGVANVTPWNRVWYTVPTQESCAFCGEELVYVAGKHDPRYVVAVLIDNVPSWCHQLCRTEAKGDSSPAMARHAARPVCECGEPWRVHMHSTDEDHGMCPTLLEVRYYVPQQPRRQAAA